MRHRRFAIGLLLGGGGALLFWVTGFAQEGDADEVIEEIVVTALKRGAGTTLLDTPLAISAIAGSELEDRLDLPVEDAARRPEGRVIPDAFADQDPGFAFGKSGSR